MQSTKVNKCNIDASTNELNDRFKFKLVNPYRDVPGFIAFISCCL